METAPKSPVPELPRDPVAALLPQTVPECHTVIAQLLERVRLLEERVNLDSNNSSKPPSSNGPGPDESGATPGQRAQARGAARTQGS